MEYKDDLLSKQRKRRWRSGERTLIIGMEMMRVSIMYRGRPSPGTFHYLSEKSTTVDGRRLGMSSVCDRPELAVKEHGTEPSRFKNFI